MLLSLFCFWYRCFIYWLHYSAASSLRNSFICCYPVGYISTSTLMLLKISSNISIFFIFFQRPCMNVKVICNFRITVFLFWQELFCQWEQYANNRNSILPWRSSWKCMNKLHELIQKDNLECTQDAFKPTNIKCLYVIKYIKDEWILQ